MKEFVFKMPDIGEGIVEAEVVAWHVSVGDTVLEDAPLADVMTDKATVEITSPVAGTIHRTGCKAGDKIVIGSDLVVFELDAAIAGNHQDGPEEDSASPRKNQSVSEETPTKTRELTSTELAATDSEESGHPQNTHQPTQGAETDVAESASDTESPAAGSKNFADKPKIRVVSDSASSESAKPAQPITDSSSAKSIDEIAGERVEAGKSASALVGVPRGGNGDRCAVLASPMVRKLARDMGIDLTTVSGSGPNGRILRQDLPALKSGSTETAQSAKGGKVTALSNNTLPAVVVATDSTLDGPDSRSAEFEDVPLFGMRRLIAEKMEASKRNIPHFSYVEEVNLDSLESLRKELNNARLESQAKLSLLHFVLLAVAKSVSKWPQCNAHYLDEGPTLRRFESVHIGVATMTDAGLVVPVLRDVGQFDIWQIAAEVNRLAEGARAGTLARDELTGSTITVTSLGTLAGISTTPIINRPETTVIGPNKMREKVVIKEGVATTTRVMNVSSSFDHRVVDGFDAASLIQALKRLLEQPAMLFMR